MPAVSRQLRPERGGTGLRQLTEVQEMRALTHPVRLALLEELSLGGALTATEAGARIGESATTCSFHLRQLSKYGYVEEAGGGTGRKRPWRLVNRGMRFSGAGDPEYSIAATELSHLLLRRWLARHEQWQAVQHLDPVWSGVAGAAQFLAFVTPEEAAELQTEISALFERYRERNDDAWRRPPGTRAIESVLLTHPFLDHTAAGDGTTEQ
ncbi:MAG: winged helix-turn-helix domain-containing protein [Acidimicrobiales bacterium]